MKKFDSDKRNFAIKACHEKFGSLERYFSANAIKEHCVSLGIDEHDSFYKKMRNEFFELKNQQIQNLVSHVAPKLNINPRKSDLIKCLNQMRQIQTAYNVDLIYKELKKLPLLWDDHAENITMFMLKNDIALLTVFSNLLELPAGRANGIALKALFIALSSVQNPMDLINKAKTISHSEMTIYSTMFKKISF